MMKYIKNIPLFLIAMFVVVLLVSGFAPSFSQTANAIICRFESTPCVTSWGDDVVIYSGQPNATLTPSLRIVATSGAVMGKVLRYNTLGQTQYCAVATVTGSASYTSTVTAISTPVTGWCNVTTITGDANKCGVIHGSGIFTVSVVNSALTPAAASGAAGVYWCGVGN